MSIRWKLLVLLLAIGLIPLVTVTWLDNRATTQLGATLGSQARASLTQLTRQQLTNLVSDKARLIAHEGSLVSLAVQVQAAEVERCLAVESPPPEDLYMAEDFDGERPPPDLAMSGRHLRSIGPGEFMPIPISPGHPVFKLAPGQMDGRVWEDMKRLALATPVYRRLQEQHRDLLFWHFTSLESGVHSSYPGHGGFPIDYDGRQRRWYANTKTAGTLIWTLPYLDATSRRSVLTASMPVYRPDGSLAGITGIDITVSGLLEQARLPRFGSSIVKVIWLDSRSETNDNGRREIDLADYQPGQLGMRILAEPLERGNEGQWHSPPDTRWLDPDDPEQGAGIIGDLYRGVPNIRQVEYNGRSTLWAYSPVWGKQGFLVVILPYAEVVFDAVRAQESVLSLTRSKSRLTAAMVGIVAAVVLAIALAGSRTVTRPVSRLVEAAQQVAAGDFGTRVNIRTRDELGALGSAFNAMVPQLEDRIRIRQSLNLAMEVQQQLLPAQPPSFAGLEVAGSSTYCDETGGDYYDFLDLCEVGPRELGLAVGDVTGHGIAAALLMTTARALLRSRADHQRNLSELMRDVNRLLVQDTPTGRFMTLFYAVVDADRRCIRWASAGHDPAILYDPAGDAFTELAGGDLPLGIDPEEHYRQFHRDQLQSGQVIVIGTDGIWEARDSQGRHFGKDGLRQVIRSAAAGTAQEICTAITDALEQFCNGNPREDDVTLVVVKFV